MAKFVLSKDEENLVKVWLKKTSRGVIVGVNGMNVFEFIDGRKKIYRWGFAAKDAGLEDAGSGRCAITDDDPGL